MGKTIDDEYADNDIVLSDPGLIAAGRTIEIEVDDACKDEPGAGCNTDIPEVAEVHVDPPFEWVETVDQTITIRSTGAGSATLRVVSSEGEDAERTLTALDPETIILSFPCLVTDPPLVPADSEFRINAELLDSEGVALGGTGPLPIEAEGLRYVRTHERGGVDYLSPPHSGELTVRSSATGEALASLQVYDASHVKVEMKATTSNETEYPFTHNYSLRHIITHSAVGEVTTTTLCIEKKFGTHLQTETPDVCTLYDRLTGSEHTELALGFDASPFRLRVRQAGLCRIVATVDGATSAGVVEHTYN